MARNVRTGTDSLVTVPMIGYVAKDGDQGTYRLSLAKFGPQDQTDAGNGRRNGAAIQGNDPLDTSNSVTRAPRP